MSRILHSDVEIVPSGTRAFLLHDRRTGDCFSLGAEEHLLLRLLGEVKSAEEVARAFQSIAGKKITRRHVIEFAENLRRCRVLDEGSEFATQAAAQPPRSSKEARGSDFDRIRKLNFRFDLLVLLFGWLLHPLMIVPAASVALMAANVLLRDWEPMQREVRGLFAGYPVLLYLLLFVAPRLLLLNLIHTLLVGITYRLVGGRLRSLTLLWWHGLVPHFALDAGDSLASVDPRGRRKLINLGVWFPLTLGAACIVAWAMTAPRSGLSTVFLLFTIACIIRLLIQANIFFDHGAGYLWLCTATNNWRLLPSSRDEIRAWLSGRVSPRPFSKRERFWLRAFGVSYYLYRFALTAVILLVGLYWIMPVYRLPGAAFVFFVAVWWNHDFFARHDARF